MEELREAQELTKKILSSKAAMEMDFSEVEHFLRERFELLGSVYAIKLDIEMLGRLPPNLVTRPEEECRIFHGVVEGKEDAVKRKKTR